jgi:hypothetical protein
VQRGTRHRADRCLPATSDPEIAPIPDRLTQGLQEELLCDLRRILEELDALRLPLAAIHVDAAICALGNAKTRLA